MLFSKRMKLCDMAIEWCEERNIPANSFNIVTALDSLGLLGQEAVEHQMQRMADEVRHGVDCRCVLCLANNVVAKTRRS
jgi:hypothetical protein